MARALPSRAELIDYNYAVAGHDGTLSDVDGELFIKPCTPAEIAFYESSVEEHPEFAEYMPTYMGTLSLDQTGGKTIEEVGQDLLEKIHVPQLVVPVVRTGKRIETNRAVVLENAGYGFVKPNIMDVKLGVRLWADDAAEEKKDPLR